MIDALLRRLGIDPKRFRLLVRLFHTLGNRKELLNQQLGFNQDMLRYTTVLYGILGTVLAVFELWVRTTSDAFVGPFLFITAFMLTPILLSETAHTLVNPEEGLVLVHQPIDGATYTAAKLTHLGRVVLYFVGSINAGPALIGLAAAGTRFWYPVFHMAAVLAEGAVIALACCALFGWLMRWVPPARMKVAAQVAAGLSYMVILPQFHMFDLVQLIWKRLLLIGPWLNGALVVLLIAAVALGLRALSADYLIRVTRMIQGRSRKRQAGSRNHGLWAWPGKAVSRWLGGPPARAGFAYLLRMTARDWQFRRQAVGFLPILSLPIVGVRSFGNPFDPAFTPAHVFPHLLGFMIFFTCSILKAGSHPKAVWVFQLSPAGAFLRFARGTYAALWAIFVLAPHALAVPLALWLWPIRDAAEFTAYSIAITSLYLSLCLGLTEGLPLGHPAGLSQTSLWILPVLIVGGIVAAAVVAIQYFFLFRSGLAVISAAAVLAAAAVWFGRRSIEGLSVAIRHYLNTLTEGKQALYQEVG